MSVPTPSLSLKKTWLAACPNSVACTITPLGFKYSIRSTLEFLIAHKLSATLWLKLPVGPVWHIDIDRYASLAKHIYSFEREGGYHHDKIADQAHWQSLSLSSNFLPGEYLFLAITDDFVCAFAAIQQAVEMGSTPRSTSSTSNRPVRKLALRLYSSCSPTLLLGLKPMLRTLVQSAPTTSKSTALIEDWDQRLPSLTGISPDRAEAFLSWQLRSQAKLSSQAHRTAQTPTPSISPTTLPASPTTLPTNFLEIANQELRTPLTTLKTALTLLNSPRLKLDQRQRYLDMIHQESNRQGTLIQGIFELLQLHTKTQPLLSPIQLTRLVPSLVSTYEPLAQEQQITLACNLPDDLPPIFGHEPWLKQALIHLLNNGLQFTPTGGQISVSAQFSTASNVTLTIQDTGRGISHGDLPKVFEAFYRGATLGNEHSAGLGLTLAKQLITQGGGSLSVESMLTRGTCFTIELPT